MHHVKANFKNFNMPLLVSKHKTLHIKKQTLLHHFENFLQNAPMIFKFGGDVVLDGPFVLSDCHLDVPAVWVQLKVSLLEDFVNSSARSSSLFSAKTFVARVRQKGEESTLSVLFTRVAFAAVNADGANSLNESGQWVPGTPSALDIGSYRNKTNVHLRWLMQLSWRAGNLYLSWTNNIGLGW